MLGTEGYGRILGMNDLANQFLVFFRDHGFWSYLVVAAGILVAAIGFAAGGG